MVKCSVCDCDVPIPRRGMCSIHYRRFMRHGDPHKLLVLPAGSGGRRNDGYWMYVIDGRSVLRHVLICEKALGKPLPKGAQVHHVDGDRGNDSPDNLVICPNAAYHQLLHRCQRALNACGHADWRQCEICKGWSPESELTIYHPSNNKWHPACRKAHPRPRKANGARV